MRLLSLFAVAMAGLIAVPALAQTPPPPDGTPTRVRGTVETLAARRGEKTGLKVGSTDPAYRPTDEASIRSAKSWFRAAG